MIQQILTNNLAVIKGSDTISMALEFMDKDDVQSITVLDEKKYIGTLIKNDLINYEPDQLISDGFDDLKPVFVFENEHFSKALKIMADKQVDVIPVLGNDKQFIGQIVATDLLFKLAQFIGADEKGAIIIIEMDRRNFAFSEISRLIETNDATITQMNTQVSAETGQMMVTIKINKIQVSDVIATLQRFEYNVLAYYGEEDYINELHDNYSHLMHYLNI